MIMKVGEDWLASREKRAMDIAIATAALPPSIVIGSLAAAALFAEVTHAAWSNYS